MKEIMEAKTPEQISTARQLFREYADSIGFDLCFQGFDRELEELPGKYAPPAGGLFIALVDGKPMGCVAVRPLDEKGAAELKRLYVRADARGMGLGIALAQKAIGRAREAGYKVIRLDTLATMKDAQRLYRNIGFKEIPAYTFNPIPEAVYMELDLPGSATS